MHFHLSTSVALSGLTILTSLLGSTALADGSNQPGTIPTSIPQADSSTFYVGSGCESSSDSSYRLYQESGSYNFEWQEATGQGFCGQAQYLMSIDRPARSEGRNDRRFVTSSGMAPNFSVQAERSTSSKQSVFTQQPWVDTSPGVYTSHTLAQWNLKSATSGNMSISVYIPKDNYQRSLSDTLRVPPLRLDRTVVYTALIGSSPSDAQLKECLSQEIDQDDHQNEFVELGSCQVNESNLVIVFLEYRNASNERVERRIVADAVRFIPSP